MNIFTSQVQLRAPFSPSRRPGKKVL